MLFRKTESINLQSYVEQMIAHQDRMRAFIYTLMPGSPHIDDVLQNTNVILWQKRAGFSADTNFTAWALRIARYQTMHQLDRDKRHGRLVCSDELLETIAEPTPEGRTHNHMMQALEVCLKKLTDQQRSLIQARYTPGQSLEKHAESIGRTPGSLRIALHRIRDLLKNCVEGRLASESL